MVECVIVSLVLVILLFAMQIVSEGYLIKHKTIAASRYAAWRLALVPETPTPQLEANVRNYFFAEDGNNLNQGTFDIDQDPAGLLDEAMGFLSPLLEESGSAPLSVAYQVKYEKSWQNDANFGSFPDHFTIGSFHQVDSNTWSGNATAFHDAFDLLTDGPEDALKGQPGLFE